MSQFNILRILLATVVGLPVGYWLYLDYAIPPNWLTVALMLGYPVLFFGYLCVGVWALPQQRAGIGTYFLLRHWLRW